MSHVQSAGGKAEDIVGGILAREDGVCRDGGRWSGFCDDGGSGGCLIMRVDILVSLSETGNRFSVLECQDIPRRQ